MANCYFANMKMLLKSITPEERTHNKTMEFYKDSIKYALEKNKITETQYFSLMLLLNN